MTDCFNINIGDTVLLPSRSGDRYYLPIPFSEEGDRLLDQFQIGIVEEIKDEQSQLFNHRVSFDSDSIWVCKEQIALVSDFLDGEIVFRERQIIILPPEFLNSAGNPRRFDLDGISSQYIDFALVAKIESGEEGGKIFLKTYQGDFSMSGMELLENGAIPFDGRFHLDEDIIESTRIRDNYKNFQNYIARYGFDRNEEYYKCRNCYNWTAERNLFHIGNGESLCGSCADDYQYKCFVCHGQKRVVHMQFRMVDNERVCNRCMETRVIECRGCRKFHIDEPWSRYGGDRYCEKCFENRVLDAMSSPPRALGRSTISKISIDPKKEFRLNKSNTAVAVEIEAMNDHFNFEEEDADPYLEYPRGWNDTYDGSLSDVSGREFMMQPEIGDAAFSRINSFCDWLRNNDWYADDSCGVHVHTDAYYLGIEELKGILVVGRALEPMIYSMLPANRLKSRYCRPMADISVHKIADISSAKEFSDLWYIAMNNTEASSDKYNSSRYCGLNIHSRFLHGTIEYRYHYGTISSESINNWVKLCLLISDFGSRLFLKKTTKQSSVSKKITNLFMYNETNDYTDYLEAMGANHKLIDYVKNMINRRHGSEKPITNRILRETSEGWIQIG